MVKTTLLTLTLMLTLASAQTVPFKPGESLPAGEYEVFRTLDADTISVIASGVERSVRFIGVDAPSLKRPVEPYGAESTAFVRNLLAGQTVYIMPGVAPVDRFGRALGHVSLEGRDVALTVAQAGYAEEMTISPNDTFAPLYTAGVAGAKAAKKGMWRDAPESRRKWRCSSFGTQAEAQAFMGGSTLPGEPDPQNLDRDNDGRACQSLPKGRLLTFVASGL